MRLDGTTPLWISARALLSQHGEDFFNLRAKVLKTYDPEDIHDLRVASRRLREGLALFAPCYPAENINRIVRRVKRVTRLLGEVRNTDEAIIFFTSLAEELGHEHRVEAERILNSFWKKRNKELKGLKAGLKEIVSGSMHDLFRRAINSPALFTPPGNGIDLFGPVSQFAGNALDYRLEAVIRLVPEARKHGNVEDQHLLRIAVKHLRYRMELLSFLFAEGYDDMHGVLKAYQDLLGKMHDLDVFTGIVRDAIFPAGIEKAFVEKIAAKREMLFADFSSMLDRRPFDMIGAWLRSAL